MAGNLTTILVAREATRFLSSKSRKHARETSYLIVSLGELNSVGTTAALYYDHLLLLDIEVQYVPASLSLYCLDHFDRSLSYGQLQGLRGRLLSLEIDMLFFCAWQ